MISTLCFFATGLFIGTFFHLFAHDQEGPIGKSLRGLVYSVISPALLGEVDDRVFAMFFMNVFMQVTGILMLPDFLGPSFNPIAAPFIWLQSLTAPSSAKKRAILIKKQANTPLQSQEASKKKKKKNKKKQS